MTTERFEDDEKRVVAHSANELTAQLSAAILGLRVQVTDYCPPGTIYIVDMPRMFSEQPEDEGWEHGIGRIDEVTG